MENVNIKLLLDAAESAKTIGELKKSFKDLKGSINDVNGVEFQQLSNALNDVEGKLGDMNDAAKTVAGSGVERLNASFGILQEGFAGADFGKVSAGFKGLGAAMDAIPIFLIIEGLKFLWDNLDKVKEVLFQMFPALDSVSQSTKNLEQENKKLTEASTKLVNSLENELRIAEAQGQSETSILNLKKKINAEKILELERDTALQKSRLTDIAQNNTLYEGALKLEASVLRKVGRDAEADLIEKAITFNKLERAKEFTDKIKENELAIANLKTDIKVDEINFEKKVTENHKQQLEDKQKAEKEAFEKRKRLKELEDAEEKKRIAEYNQFYKDQLEQQIADTNEELEQAKREQEIADRERKAKNELDFQQGNITRKQYLDEQMAIELANTNLTENEKLLIKQKYAEESKKLKTQEIQNDLAIATQGVQAAQGLSDMLFSIKSANTKKGSVEEEKAARLQFKINKGLSISSTTIKGAEAVVAALTTPGPLGIAKAIAVGITTAASIAKIAATQFESGGSGGGSISTPIVGEGLAGAGSQPNFQAPTFFGLGQVSGGGSNQKQAQQVFVTEGDISKVQKRVSVIESRSKIN